MKKILLLITFACLSLIITAQSTRVYNYDLTLKTTTPTLKLDGANGTFLMDGATSGTITIKPPAVAGSAIITLPGHTTTFTTTNTTNITLPTTGTLATDDTLAYYAPLASPTITGVLTTGKINIGGTDFTIDSIKLVNGRYAIFVGTDTIGPHILASDIEDLGDVAVLLGDTLLNSGIYKSYRGVYYTQRQVDSIVVLKANVASPTLTGTPAAPTAGVGTNTTQIATTAFVQTALATTNLLADTTVLMNFNVGHGINSDSSYFETSTIYESFWNGWSDSLVVTGLKAVMMTGGATDTLGLQISWDDTLKSANATNLASAALAIGRPHGLTTGTYYYTDNFANTTIPPGVWVWAHTPYVKLANKPEYLGVTMLGYKKAGDIDITQFFCAEYDTVYSAMTTKPSNNVALAQNAMVYSLDSAGYWDRMDQLLVFATEYNTDSEALINWIDPGTNDGGNAAATPWTQWLGYTGNATNDYISTNFIVASADTTVTTPTGGYGKNDAAIGIYLQDDQQEDSKFVFGSFVSDGRVYLAPRNASNQSTYAFHANAGTTLTSITDSRGLWILSRTAINATALYQNGASKGTDTDLSVNIPTSEFRIFVETGTASYSDHQASIFFLMDGVADATEADKIYDIFQRYMTAINANWDR